MFVIPYGNITIKSNLKKSQIEDRLKARIEPQRFISGFLRGEHKYFEGELKNGQFKINPVIEIRNSFNPVITGEIQQNTDCTVINMSMRLHHIVSLLFLSFFVSLFSFIVLPEITFLFDVFVLGEGRGLYEILPEGHFFQVITIFAIFSLSLYLFMMVPFNIEVDKAIKYLENMFDGQSISQ
jgi:hypothetical protein